MGKGINCGETIRALKKAIKYMILIKKFGHKKGIKLRKAIARHNIKSSENKTSYSRVVQARKIWRYHGVMGFLSKE
jgi:hypothetical protein